MDNKMQIILPGEFIESILEGIEADPNQAVLINALLAKLQLVNSCMNDLPAIKATVNQNLTQLLNATFN